LALKLRGALLGAGNIALDGHGPQWARNEAMQRDVEIVAVADLSPSNLEAARTLFPRATLYLPAQDLLSREDLDFCDICTPPFTHRPLIEEASERGLHVLCEKPLATTFADAQSISRAVRASGIVFEPCHQYHHSPDWQAVRRLLPRLGRIHFAEYQVHRMQANEGNPHWSPGWRTDRDFAGGGILMDHGAHVFYQLRSILGEPRTVQATVRTLRHRSYGVEDTALVILDFGECLAKVSLTWAGQRRQIQFRFVGERGELIGDDRGVRMHADVREQIDFAREMNRGSSHCEWYAPLFRRFVERIRSQDRSRDTLEEAVYVTRLITRAYESSRTGRTLPVAAAGPPSEGEPSEVGAAWALAADPAPVLGADPGR
jgi:predicted dehydrogenase